MAHPLFIISGPAACGKTTIVNKLLEAHPKLQKLVTTTTRPPRRGELDAIDYHFKSKSEFNALLEKDAFVEHAEYNGQLYGLSKSELFTKLKNGACIAILEIQGAAAIRRTNIQHYSIFISPPDMRALRSRIEERNADSEENIKNRLQIAQKEMKAANLYDFQICNNSLEAAIREVEEIILQKIGKSI